VFRGTICLQLVGCGARYGELFKPSAGQAPNLECLEPKVNYGPPYKTSGSQDSSVGTVTRLRAARSDIRIPIGTRDEEQIGVRECLPFGAESFVFLFAIQKYEN